MAVQQLDRLSDPFRAPGEPTRREMLRRRVSGRTHHYRLEAASLAGAQRWIAFHERFWNQRLGALETPSRTTATPDPDAAAGVEATR